MKILISPYSRALRNGNNNPKNYPYWDVVVSELVALGHEVIQIGVGKEAKIDGVTDTFFNRPLKELKKKLEECDLFIGVDNFFQHFCHLHGKRGIVIFSLSNPKIFGHPENTNLLKNEKYLRPKQFDIWETAEYNLDAYVDPSTVVDAVKNWR